MHFLKKYQPKKDLVLDAGGEPERYMIELAREGYDVVLLDLSEENIKFAKQQIDKENLGGKLKDINKGDIRDLSMFSKNTFDAVICLGGPLSHIKGKNKEENCF